MPSVLIIDDDDQFRKLIKRFLERAGYEVLEASNGIEGINMYKRIKADLIVTDLIMPEQEGIETIIKLRREYPTVKIIAMSGGGMIIEPDNYLKIARNLFVQYTFKKPFERDEFLSAVYDLTHKHASKTIMQ